MMLTIKLTGSAFEYADGNRPAAEFEALDDIQKERSFKQLPTLLEWMSYCFFFPTLLVGPPCGLKEYLAFTDRSMFKEEGGKIPSVFSFQALGKKVLMVAYGLVCHFLHAKFPVQYSSTAAFWQHPFWYRLCYVIITTELSFEHYYFGWSNAEAACVIAGLAYNGRDKRGALQWNRVGNTSSSSPLPSCLSFLVIHGLFKDMVGHYEMRFAQNGTVVGRNWNVSFRATL